MQRAIFAGGARADFAGEVVTGNDRLSPAECVGIYAGGYRMRLIECLRDEFRALRLFAGETAFDLFASGYIDSHPSSRPSLYDFGAGFADHLAATAPPQVAEHGSPFRIPAQLARIERARSESRRAVGVEREQRPSGPLLAAGVRLRIPDSVRLLRLDFDFAPLLAAAERGEPGPMPAAEPTCVAVARSRWHVRVHRIAPRRFAFLEALAAGDGDAEAALTAYGGEPGAARVDLSLWLPHAAAAGIVARRRA
jgi:hypothetical protein